VTGLIVQKFGLEPIHGYYRATAPVSSHLRIISTSILCKTTQKI